jgi:hypothetical protein
VPRDALDETGRLYRVEPCLGWVKRFTPQSCLVRSRFTPPPPLPSLLLPLPMSLLYVSPRNRASSVPVLAGSRERGTKQQPSSGHVHAARPTTNVCCWRKADGRRDEACPVSTGGRGGGLWAARVRTGAEAVILGEGGVVRLEPLLHLHRRWVGLRPLCTGQGRGARQVCTGKGGRDAGGRAPTCQIGTCGCDERRCLPTSPCACSPFNDRKIYTENLRGSPTDDHDLVHFMCGGAV